MKGRREVGGGRLLPCGDLVLAGTERPGQSETGMESSRIDGEENVRSSWNVSHV